ncbi:unnamed protein product [Litomosoides sigmodontis]|uniref:Uncharacterized protein n=1 Tax=Litomosoides sigmodontis TaxID=42156 RepID=A0A3P6TMB6_LITSI|nr:unnamed protein product [Litomosoides sigmodontis]
MSSAPNLHIQPDNGADMSAKRKTSNTEVSDEEDELIQIFEDAGQQFSSQVQGGTVIKKSRAPKKQMKSAGVPPCINVNGVPAGVEAAPTAAQMNHPRMQQPQHATTDQARHSDIPRNPTVVGHANLPPNVATIFQASSCWCNQLATEMHAIREHVNAISSGLDCIIHKVNTDQVENTEMMSRMSNTIEMIAEALTHLPLAQWQECDGYLIEDGTVGAFTDGAYYMQGNEQQPPTDNFDYGTD